MAPLQHLYDRYCLLIHKAADKIRLTEHTVITQLMAELFGSMILILYVNGAGAQYLLGPHSMHQFINLPLGSGGGLVLAILVTGKACQALVNPALALSHTIVGRLRWSLCLPYILLEFLGAYLGAGLVLAVYHNKIIDYANNYDGGKFLMNTTGTIFVTPTDCNTGFTFEYQLFTTAGFIIATYAFSEPNLVQLPSFAAIPWFGMLVYLAIDSTAAVGGAPLNPMRDFGPRMMLLSTYWGPEAFRYNYAEFWVPLVAPTIGTVLGAIIYELLIGIHSDRVIDYGDDASKASDVESAGGDESAGDVESADDVESPEDDHEAERTPEGVVDDRESDREDSISDDVPEY